MTRRTLVCAQCLEEFDTEVSEEEAQVAYKEAFPDDSFEDATVVCTSCLALLGLFNELEDEP